MIAEINWQEMEDGFKNKNKELNLWLGGTAGKSGKFQSGELLELEGETENCELRLQRDQHIVGYGWCLDVHSSLLSGRNIPTTMMAS